MLAHEQRAMRSQVESTVSRLLDALDAGKGPLARKDGSCPGLVHREAVCGKHLVREG